MGTVSRPVKTAGTTSYTTEKAILGATAFIRAAEVDADLATLYTVVNGDLDDDNLADGISGTKLADLSIPFTKLGDASIPATKLQNDTITKDQISPTAGILGSQLAAAAAIAGTQLAVGAAIHTSTTAIVASGLDVNTGETTMVTFPSITVRGGRVKVSGTWGLYIHWNGTGTMDATLRFKRGATTVETFLLSSLPGSAGQVMMCPPPLFFDTPAAGSYVYTITGQTNNTDLRLQSGISNRGNLLLEEAS